MTSSKEPCYDYQHGHCKFGASCIFSHSMGDNENMVEVLINGPVKEVAPKSGDVPVKEEDKLPDPSQGEPREASPSQPCRKRPRPQRICFDFVKGRCTHGENCNFSHREPEKSKPVCSEFLKGSCDRGENCDFSHDMSRTRLCYDWKNGRCNWGKYCNFSHDGSRGFERHARDWPVQSLGRRRREVGWGNLRVRTRDAGWSNFRRNRWDTDERRTSSYIRDSEVKRRRIGGERQRVCFDFVKGRCREGESCDFKHPNPEDSEKPKSRRFCYDFKAGRCNFGEYCSFSHERMPGRTSNRLCLDFKRGNCSYGELCQFSHNIEKLGHRVCLDFQKGFCSYRNSCTFSHDLRDLLDGGRSARRVCLDYRKGHCNRGDNCSFSHDLERFANRKCLDFQKGNCSYGDTCSFSHDI